MGISSLWCQSEQRGTQDHKLYLLSRYSPRLLLIKTRPASNELLFLAKKLFTVSAALSTSTSTQLPSSFPVPHSGGCRAAMPSSMWLPTHLGTVFGELLWFISGKTLLYFASVLSGQITCKASGFDVCSLHYVQCSGTEALYYRQDQDCTFNRDCARSLTGKSDSTNSITSLSSTYKNCFTSLCSCCFAAAGCLHLPHSDFPRHY